jgi:single-strand DNA-binding protein
MPSINKAIIVGHLGADPDIKQTKEGKSFGTLSVATSDTWTSRDGEKVENTEWHRVKVWDKQAEFAGKYLRKGSLVYVEGKIETRKYDDKEGVTRYTTEIKAHSLQGLDRREKGSTDGGESTAPSDGASYQRPAGLPSKEELENMDDDLPF